MQLYPKTTGSSAKSDLSLSPKCQIVRRHRNCPDSSSAVLTEYLECRCQIFPAVVRYDEIQRGLVEHAMRVTVRRTRRAYVHPATHFASRLDDEDLPRMGERLRLHADFDVSGFSSAVQAILNGLKKYGMVVADNGMDWAISVTPDPRIPVLHEELRRIKGADFEVVAAPE